MTASAEAMEQERLRELRALEDQEAGGVSQLRYETAALGKVAFAKRLRATLAALRAIQADPSRAQEIAAAALAADGALAS